MINSWSIVECPFLNPACSGLWFRSSNGEIQFLINFEKNFPKLDVRLKSVRLFYYSKKRTCRTLTITGWYANNSNVCDKNYKLGLKK